MNDLVCAMIGASSKNIRKISELSKFQGRPEDIVLLDQNRPLEDPRERHGGVPGRHAPDRGIQIGECRLGGHGNDLAPEAPENLVLVHDEEAARLLNTCQD